MSQDMASTSITSSETTNNSSVKEETPLITVVGAVNNVETLANKPEEATQVPTIPTQTIYLQEIFNPPPPSVELPPESTHKNEAEDLPGCHICKGDGPWYSCSKCEKMICNSCLSDIDPTQCKSCTPNIQLDVKPLTEEVYDPAKDKTETVTHKGKLFIPIGTAMITTCGTISNMTDEILEKQLSEYAGFVKEAEETLDRRRVMHAMLKREKADRYRLKHHTGLPLPEGTVRGSEIELKKQAEKEKKPKVVKQQSPEEALNTVVEALAKSMGLTNLTPEMRALLIQAAKGNK